MECTPGAVSMFKARHKEEISALQNQLTQKTDHLWISHVANRVAALDQMHADLQDLKRQRMEDDTTTSATLVPVVNLPGNRDKAHGYEITDVKWIGDFKTGREVHLKRFDRNLFEMELKVLNEAANQLGQLRSQETTVNNNLLLQQNGQNVNYFDRASVMAVVNRIQAAKEEDTQNP